MSDVLARKKSLTLSLPMTAKTVIAREKPYAEVKFFLKRHGGSRAVLRKITPQRGFFNTIGSQRDISGTKS